MMPALDFLKKFYTKNNDGHFIKYCTRDQMKAVMTGIKLSVKKWSLHFFLHKKTVSISTNNTWHKRSLSTLRMFIYIYKWVCFWYLLLLYV